MEYGVKYKLDLCVICFVVWRCEKFLQSVYIKYKKCNIGEIIRWGIYIEGLVIA